MCRTRWTICVSIAAFAAGYFLFTKAADPPLRGSGFTPPGVESAGTDRSMSTERTAVRPAEPREEGTATPASVARSIPEWVHEALGLDESETSSLLSNLQPLAGGDGLHPTDLAVLEEIIRINQLDESSSPFDYDNGDGVLEPWELGYQVWRDGRLVLFATGPSPRFSFGYGIEFLPESIGDLAHLRVLDLHRNALRELPETLGALGTLRELHLSDNHLSALPITIGELTALRRAYLGGNDLTEVPR